MYTSLTMNVCDDEEINSFGQYCTSKCIVEICQDAENDVTTGSSNNKQAESLEVQSRLDKTRRGVYRECLSTICEDEQEEENANCVWTDVPRITPSGKMKFKPQSGTTQDNVIMKISNKTEYENVQFTDQHDPYMYDMKGEMDPTRKLMDSDDATLDHFFSRPLKIHEVEWGTGTSLYSSIDPWSLYFENPRVINRIVNYNLLRAKLHVKIVINGNGFQYGRAIASYLPFDIWDSLSRNTALIPTDIVQASQQPHVYLDPTTSSGGEMILPFFEYRNYLNVPGDDWNEMGTLTIRSINDLKHANGASDQVTISVFAWAEEVAMSVLTSAEPSSLTPQSGKEVDEANTKGMISGPATAVAKAAGALSVIPQIAPFAIATEAGASVVAKVAKALGYCRPPQTKDPDLYNPRPHSSLAVTTTPDAVNKLTVDDKQELTIDPRVAGLSSSDPLNIKEIAKRESYLTTFNWTMGTAPESILWNARVDPVTWAEDGLTPNGYHFPACAMAALPFRYWTGTMKFRFQVVCSAFHKGRIKIVYDPNNINTNEYNTNYLQIVDIADRTDFTIEVGNGQYTSLLQHHVPGVDSVTQMYSTTRYTSPEEGNGVLAVYVVNELTTPNSAVNNDIQINVFVSMGDDFEVFVPDCHFQNFVFQPQSGREGSNFSLQSERDREERLISQLEVAIQRYETIGRRLPTLNLARLRRDLELKKARLRGYKPQSGQEIVPESQNTEEPSAPQHSESENLGPGYTNDGLLNKVFTGEAIASFRTLLKRYNLHQSLIFAQDSSPRIHAGRRSAFPYLRGNVSGAVNTTAALASYNYCNTVLLHWVTYAFSGWRGSIRWKILPRGEMTSDRRPQLYVQRAPPGGFEYDKTSNTLLSAYSVDADSAWSVVKEDSLGIPADTKPFTGVNGEAFAQGMVNPNMEFEMPFYNIFRFVPGKTQDLTSLAIFSEPWDYRIIGDFNVDTNFDAYCAAGEDFQVFFFTGLPPMYYEAAPPAP